MNLKIFAVKYLYVLFFAGVSFLLVSCGSPQKQARQQGNKNNVVTTVALDGSSTVFPISEAVSEEFQKENSDIRITVGVSGTGGGFKKFCNGETDISDASRPIEDKEINLCKSKNIEYIVLNVALDGLSVVVNPQNNWAKCLTIAELKKIWQPNSKIKYWNQVRKYFPKEEIKLYGPGTDSGTFDYFTKEIVGEEKASRADYTASEDDNVLVQGVAGEKGGLGYFGYAYYEENKDKLKLVAVNGGNGCILPDRDTITGGIYKPLSRPLFIYVNKKSLQKEEVKKFVEYYLNAAKSLVGDVGYITLKDSEYEKSLKELTNTGK